MTTLTTNVVSERALLMLEIIASAEEPPTLNELMRLIELPKATTHRFVSRLEKLGFAQRTVDGKRYEVGYRLTALAIDAMRHSFALAPRRAILSGLVNEIGETCNITMLDGTELIYLDRVEIRLAVADPSQDRIARPAPLHRERQALSGSGAGFIAKGTVQVATAAQAYPANHRRHCRAGDRTRQDTANQNWHRRRGIHRRHECCRRPGDGYQGKDLRHGRGARSHCPAAAAACHCACAGIVASGKGDRKDLAQAPRQPAAGGYITMKTSPFSISTSKRRSRSLP